MNIPTFIRRASVPAIAGLVLVSACSSTNAAYDPPPPAKSVLTVSAMDDMFHGPGTIAAGMTRIQLDNTGPSAHEVQLLRLHDGVTTDAAIAAAKSPDMGALFALVDPDGGAGTVDGGGSQTVTLDLAPGTYLEACFVRGPDGVPHVAKGMLSVLTVTAAHAPTPAPIAVRTVTLHDFRFDLPDPFGGTGTLAVTNDGPQPHELAIVKLADGKTVSDAVAFFSGPASGPPPFTDAGGVAALAPGQTGYVDLHLAPGSYAALCLVPDRATGKPHALLGMASAFTVN